MLGSLAPETASILIGVMGQPGADLGNRLQSITGACQQL
jgi:hypothetical protein